MLADPRAAWNISRVRSASPIVALAVLVGIAILSAVSLGTRALGDGDASPTPWGVRLGMSATEVRAQVEARASGTWSTRLENDDWILERTADHEHATFELHDARLVAVRIEAPAASDFPAEPAYEATEGSVLVRETQGDHVALTLLSRSCPTHRDEATRLVAAHGGD